MAPFAREPLRVTVTALPGPQDVNLPVDVGRVVELLAR
jgi:hypothetical protein